MSDRLRRALIALITPPLIASGCVGHQKVGRPPSPSEIQSINAYGQAHGNLQVEYVTPLPACAAGACKANQEVRGLAGEVVALVSADARDTVVATTDGRKWNLRSSDVAGVSATDRARGAAVGAAVCGGGALGVSVLSWAALSKGKVADGSSSSNNGEAVKAVLLVTAFAAAAGGLWGLLIGGRRSFDFSGPVAASPQGGDESWTTPE